MNIEAQLIVSTTLVALLWRRLARVDGDEGGRAPVRAPPGAHADDGHQLGSPSAQSSIVRSISAERRRKSE